MQVAQSQQPVNLFRYVVVICKDFSVVVRVSIQVAEDSQVWYSSSFLIHFSLGTYSITRPLNSRFATPCSLYLILLLRDIQMP